jgi:hypothetical protein
LLLLLLPAFVCSLFGSFLVMAIAAVAFAVCCLFIAVAVAAAVCFFGLFCCYCCDRLVAFLQLTVLLPTFSPARSLNGFGRLFVARISSNAFAAERMRRSCIEWRSSLSWYSLLPETTR